MNLNTEQRQAIDSADALPASSCAFPCSECPLHNSHCAGNAQRTRKGMIYSTEKEREALLGMASAMLG